MEIRIRDAGPSWGWGDRRQVRDEKEDNVCLNSHEIAGLNDMERAFPKQQATRSHVVFDCPWRCCAAFPAAAGAHCISQQAH